VIHIGDEHLGHDASMSRLNSLVDTAAGDRQRRWLAITLVRMMSSRLSHSEWASKLV
jgi:hypothetical protein